MSHHCGLVIENVLQKDEGTWQCNLDLLDRKSNFHTFKKVIDLKVSKRRRQRNQRRRRRDKFNLYGGYGYEYGSGKALELVGVKFQEVRNKDNNLDTREIIFFPY